MEYTAENLERTLVELIALWDERANEGWTVEDRRHPSNVAMISAYSNHVVNLSRAVLALHRDGLDFEAIGLVRSSMECVATTSWLYLFPEKTLQLVVHSSSEMAAVVKSFERAGFDSFNEPAKEHQELLAELGKPDDLEAQQLWRRFVAVAGGRELYAVYRALCSFDHATNTLADQYTQDVGKPLPRLLTHARADEHSSSLFIGTQAGMLLRAHIAADLTLETRRNEAALNEWAARLDVDPTIVAMSEVEG